MNLTIMPYMGNNNYQLKRSKNIGFKNNAHIANTTLKLASAAVGAVGVAAIKVATSKPQQQIDKYSEGVAKINDILEENKELLDANNPELASYIRSSLSLTNVDPRIAIYENFKDLQKFQDEDKIDLLYLLDFTDNKNYELAEKLCKSEEDSEDLPMTGIMLETNDTNMELALALVDLKGVNKSDMPNLLENTTKRSAEVKLATLELLTKDNYLNSEDIYDIVFDITPTNAIYKVALYDKFRNDSSLTKEELGNGVSNIRDYNVDEYLPDFRLEDYEDYAGTDRYCHILKYS